MVFSFLKQEPQAPLPDPTVLLSEAQECIEKEDFEGALGKFDQLCSLPVQSPLPLLSRATCRLQLKQYEGVVEDCEKVLTFLNSDIDSHQGESCTTVHSLALMRMAKAYKELGQVDNAKSALMRKNAIEHKLGRDRMDTDDNEENEDGELLATKDRQAAEEWKEKGNAEFKQENWSTALEYYRNGLGYDMYNPKLHSNACMALIKLKRWSQALRHADQCIALEPKWVKGYYMKGLVLSNESRIEQALAVLRHAVTLEPSSQQVKSLLDEVESRVNYVETRLRRRKNAKPSDDDKKQKAEDSGVENSEQQPVEDVDSDEDYCNDDSCRTPKKIQLKLSRKDITDTLIELAVSIVGVVIVWWLVTKND
ncbi:hypothetical protein GGI12_003312 [Dipsacomyces acuminosporus]|nr:hypothetical protein GGI12_003312 [Dipsacomyces acuminosporus]